MKKIIFYTAVLLMNATTLIAQKIITADSVITKNTIIATVDPASLHSKTVYATGLAEFSNNSGYVRILLTDIYGYDLLIYESSPLLAVKGQDYFISEALESVDIPVSLNLTKIRVEITNAVLKNLRISISDKGLTATQRKEIMSNKITTINKNLQERNALWAAGITEFSKKSYEEKKAAFGGILPDLGGAEYYIGGIFELNPDVDYRQINTNSN